MSRAFLAFAVCVLAACGRAAPPRTTTQPAAPRVARAAPPQATLAVPVTDADAAQGATDAPVTIVMFIDLQDPWSGRGWDTLRRLRETHDAATLRIVLKHLPLAHDPHPELAARVAEGVRAMRGNDAFFRFAEAAYADQRHLTPDTLRAWAVAAGADAGALERGLLRGTWNAAVWADRSLATHLGSQGTPSSFVNGVKIDGAQPSEKFAAVIQTELEAAAALIRLGVPRGEIYRTRVAHNYVAPVALVAPVEDSRTVWRVPVQGAPSRGAADALVTVVEFGDFQAPSCGTVRATLARLQASYGDRLRVVWKDRPLLIHPAAMPAAYLAREARAQKGDAGFWDVHERLLAAQPRLEQADLQRMATEAGLDLTRAGDLLVERAHEALVATDTQLGRDLAVADVPTFFINGRRLTGNRPYESFVAIVDEEIGKSKVALARGVAAHDLYEALMQTAKVPDSVPPPKLTMSDTRIGTGKAAAAGKSISVHVTTSRRDGRVVDASRPRGGPLRFVLGTGVVLKGLDEGILGMKVGGVRSLTLPAELAYGSRGVPGKVHPSETMVFEVELVAVHENDSRPAPHAPRHARTKAK